jgi:hypothetical protein
LYSTPEVVISTSMFGSLEVAPNASIGGSPSRVNVPPVFALFCFGSTLTFANGSVVVLRGSVFGATVVVGAAVVAVLDELATTVVELDDVDVVELDDVVGAADTVNVPVWYVMV